MSDDRTGTRFYIERVPWGGSDSWCIEAYRGGFGVSPTRRAVRADDGTIEWIDVVEGASRGPLDPPPLLVIPGQLMQAFWSAVEERYDPPTESKALREALAVERARVDRVLDNLNVRVNRAT